MKKYSQAITSPGTDIDKLVQNDQALDARLTALEQTVNLLMQQLEVIPLQGFVLKRPLGLVYNKNKVFTKAAQIFLKSISKS